MNVQVEKQQFLSFLQCRSDNHITWLILASAVG